MRRPNGFGFIQPVRGLTLGQTQISETGEPDLARALAHLTPGEREDYKGWGAPEKTLFLLGYQYLAVAAAKDLKRPDGTPFNGFLPEGISSAFTLLLTASGYVKDLGSLSDTLDEETSILKDANDQLETKSESAVKKYRALRDRVAWEMANAGVTVEYDIVGDDPSNPGVIYQRKVGADRTPDLSAVFSQKTPAQMYQIGKDLEARYAALGVPFERSLGATVFPILAVLIVLVVGILMFFYLFWNHKGRAQLHDQTVDLIVKDPKLTAQEKADLLFKLRSAESFWGEIFGALPWTTLIITAGIALVAFFALPPLIMNMKKVKP